jgi:RIO kinase 1
MEFIHREKNPVDLIIKDKKMENYDNFDELEGLPRIKNMPDGRHPKPWRKTQRKEQQIAQLEIQTSLQDQKDDFGDYVFSYDASRHERVWIMDSLGLFFEMQWFADVLRLVKGGKEASVYQCIASRDSPIEGNYIAAKVYRPRRFRNLRNDYIYREGREELDDAGNPIIREKMMKAINQRSNYGREVMHTSWLEHEYKTMQILHADGVDIPKPYASGPNAILLDFVGDSEMAAATLNQVNLDRVEAQELFERVIHNIEIMLTHERVHADLSAYNILYWKGEIKLIDFPQAISPFDNQSAFLIFKRDLRRICDYFGRQGVIIDYEDLAERLWNINEFRQIPELNLGFLDEEDGADRAYWDELKDDF